MKNKKIIALMGNPNVGKSTVFNEITGSHQHTGNWTGKTVDVAKGEFYYKYNDYDIYDLPGTYSLLSSSEEERIARDFLSFEEYDCVVVVVDSTALLKNLNLVYQVCEVTDRVILLLNLADEAKKKNIFIDTQKLSNELCIPVIRATARSGKGINALLEQINTICTNQGDISSTEIAYSKHIEDACKNVKKALDEAIGPNKRNRFYALRLLENNNSFNSSFEKRFGSIGSFEGLTSALKKSWRLLEESGISQEEYTREIAVNILDKAFETTDSTVKSMPSKKEEREKLLDKILLGKYTSVPVMLIMLGVVLWITIAGSNYPSEFLRSNFDSFEIWLADRLYGAGFSETFISLTVNGMLRVLLWVVAVMLPPMAIFFPLFAILEDFGILPRFAFNLDRPFERCGACGKQALTTCMGFGCNAVGVTGCRIIDSPRERLVAIITNSLTPCNGRFPLLIAIISMFFCENSLLCAVILLGFIVLSLSATLINSKVLTSTLLKGVNSSLIIELPSYRRPKFLRLITDTVREKIILVLFRAVVVAAPAGLIIWALANIDVKDTTLLCAIADALNPIGEIIGLDGVMLLAFILGFPANEIVIPIALMAYLSTGEMNDYSSLENLRSILTDNGWTDTTAICTCIFSMFHFPCSTTLLTIWKETKSIKWSALSVLAPLVTGFIMCLFINLISKLF